jgi:hypothetical protein
LRQLYRGYDLLISSEIPVPGAVEITDADPAAAADIEIVLGDTALMNPERVEGSFSRAGSSLQFDAPHIARYLCEDGRRIVVERARRARDEDVANRLVATALPALIWMRPGELVLHAAGALLEGQTRLVAIAGRSGAGKSTLLRGLIEQGSRVVGDDTLRITFTRSQILASGLPASFWLADVLSPNDRSRSLHAVPQQKTCGSAPLGRLFLLQLPRRASQSCFQTLTQTDIIRLVMSQRHRPQVARLMNTGRVLLPLLERLTQLRAYLWHREEGAVAVSQEEIAFLSADAA